MTWGTKWYEESNDMRNQMVGGVKWYEGSNDMRIRGSNDYPGEKTVLPLRETIPGVTVCSAVAVGRIPGGWEGSQQVNSHSGTRSALLFKIQVALVLFHIQVNGWGWWGEGGRLWRGWGGEARRAWCRGFLPLGLHCVRLLPSLTWFPQQNHLFSDGLQGKGKICMIHPHQISITPYHIKD